MGIIFKPFCTTWSLEESPKQIKIRQKSPGICRSGALSLLHPRYSRRQAARYSWNCCLLAMTNIYRANSSMATTLNQEAVLIIFFPTDFTAMLLFWDLMFMPGSPEGGGGCTGKGPRAGTQTHCPNKYLVTPGLRLQNETWAVTMRHLRL